MDTLKELIYILNRNKIKQIEILDLNTQNGSRVNELYCLISKGEVQSDEEAFKALFPNAKSSSVYRNLKVKLREKLVNTLFFIDAYQNESTDRQKAYYESNRDFAATQLMLAKNARQSAVKQMKKILKTAQHFEFTEMAKMICRLLRLHYGTREGDAKQYYHYN